MNIYSKHGSNVKYLDENGYRLDREYARKCGLVKGQVYTVEYTWIGQSSTMVGLVEFPEHEFNSVMFEDYNETVERSQISILKKRIVRIDETEDRKPDIGKCYVFVDDGNIAYYKILNFYDDNNLYADEYSLSNKSLNSRPECIVSKQFIIHECKLISPTDFDSVSNVIEGILIRTYNEFLEAQ